MKKLLVSLGLLLSFITCLVTPVFAGTSIDLATSTKWNIRIDGPAASASLSNGAVRVDDLDSDGLQDLIVGAYGTSNNSRSFSGSLYIIYGTLLQSLAGTGNTIDLSSSSNYNLRFDGPAAFAFFSVRCLSTADIDDDGKKDLLVGSSFMSNNSRSSSGSVYVIYNTLLDNYSGTGNNIDLNTSTNYNLRLDGSAANEGLCSSSLDTADINNDGSLDIVIGAGLADKNSKSNSGSAYVIYSSIFSSLTGTGNNIDLNTSTNYNIRYDGGTAGDFLSERSVFLVDLDSDNKKDLLLGAYGADNNSRSGSGSFYIIYNTLIDDYSNTGNNVSLGTNSNFNIRFDGAANDDGLGFFPVAGLLDTDNNIDIAVGANGTDFNSRSGSGSVYGIYNSIFSTLAGTGNTVDLNVSSNYNFRFDGAAASDALSTGGILIADVDYDSRQDVVVSDEYTDYNSRGDSGSIYVIYNSLFGGFSGTGNSLDLASSSSYGQLFTGATASDTIGNANLFVGDINNDGRNDIFAGGAGADYNSRSGSGSLWLIYNFPHNVNISQLSGPVLSGTIAVSANSTTSLAGVQFQIGSNSPTGNWTSCALSGASFACNLTSTAVNQTIYVRAYDTNTTYTAQNSYGTYTISQQSGTGSNSGGSDDPNSRAGWKNSITIGPNRVGSAGTNGYLSNQGVAAFMSNNIASIDLYINPQQAPNITTGGLATCSPVYDFRAFSAFNGYPVLASIVPYTIVLTLTPGTNCTRIAYLNKQTNTWNILPGPYVTNKENNSLATVTQQFSYYVGVGPNFKEKITKEVRPSTKVNTKPLQKSTAKPKTPVPIKNKLCLFGFCF